jgi:hypothetical protein
LLVAGAEESVMGKAMSAKDWYDRGDAYEEAADHLTQSWADEPNERLQGKIVEKNLRREAEKCRRIGDSFA